jgi:hypothetical protein
VLKLCDDRGYFGMSSGNNVISFFGLFVGTSPGKDGKIIAGNDYKFTRLIQATRQTKQLDGRKHKDRSN